MTARLLTVLALLIFPAIVQAQEFVVTFGGDVNFARSRQSPRPDSVVKSGVHSIVQLAENLARDWDGDVNFINVETVVSDRRDLSALGKTFVFRSHPASLEYLMELGVNAFSLANNHAQDYGYRGLAETLKHFQAAAETNEIVFAGLGDFSTAFRPQVQRINGFDVALTALTFGSRAFDPRADRVGVLRVSNDEHLDLVIQLMARTKADIKIMSFHMGTENQIVPNSGQRALYRRMIEEAKADLVLVHHPHVVRPVEVYGEENAAVYYSLGNLLFIGGANKDFEPTGRDYGLVGKAYFYRTDAGLSLSAIEAAPYKGVHLSPKRLDGAAFSRRIDHLNNLSRTSLGEGAARFTVLPGPRPRAVQCLGGPYGRKSEALCCGLDPKAMCHLPDLM